MKNLIFFCVTILLMMFWNCKEEVKKDIENSAIQNPAKQESEEVRNEEAIEENKESIKPKGFMGLLPKGYEVLDSIKGDLNLDKIDDIVVVLKKPNEEETSDVAKHPEKRPLLLFLRDANGGLELAARNDNVVLCVDCGGMMGDPYSRIVIKNGYFSVEQFGGSGWRWNRIITFKYNPSDKKWYLHKDGTENFHNSEPEKVEREILTTKDFGKVPFEKFTVYRDDI